MREPIILLFDEGFDADTRSLTKGVKDHNLIAYQMVIKHADERVHQRTFFNQAMILEKNFCFNDLLRTD